MPIESQSHFFNTTTFTVSGDNSLNITSNITLDRENSINTTKIEVPGTGQSIVNISDIILNNLSNYNLVIDGTPIINVNAYNIIDNNDNDDQNSWLAEVNGKFFALFRLDENNQKSNNGTTLMIAPIDPKNPNPEKYTDNNIIIPNFPFAKAFNKENPLGFSLGYNITNTVMLNDKLGTGYETISLGNNKGFLTYKNDANGNPSLKTYDISGSPINNVTITNSITENNSYITTYRVVPLSSGNFLFVNGKTDENSIKEYTYNTGRFGGTTTKPVVPAYYTEINVQEYDVNCNSVGVKTTIAKGDFNELKQIALLSDNEILVAYDKFKYQDNDITKKQSLGSFSQIFNHNTNNTLANITDVIEVNKQPTNSTNPYTTYNSTLNEYTIHKSLNGTITNTTAITEEEHIDKKVVDKNGNKVSNSIISYGDLVIRNITRISDLPIPKVINILSLDRNTDSIDTKNGINIIEVNENGVNAEVRKFDTEHDYISFPNSNNNTTPPEITITQKDGNTVIDFKNTNTTLTLPNLNQNITADNFVFGGKQGNVVLIDGGTIDNGVPVTGMGETVNFNQMFNKLALNLT